MSTKNKPPSIAIELSQATIPVLIELKLELAELTCEKDAVHRTYKASVSETVLTFIAAANGPGNDRRT